MSYTLSDQLMEEIVRAEFEMSMEKYKSVQAPPLSKEFHQKMNSYFVRRKKKRLASIAIAIAAVMVLGATTVLAVEPLRERVFAFFESIFSDRTTISFQVDDTLKLDEEFREFYISGLPDSYSLDDEYVWPEVKQGGYYFYDEEQEIILTFNYGDVEDMVFTVTSEIDYPPETEIREGIEVRHYFDGEYRTIMWFSGEYCFVLSANISLDDLYKYMDMIIER